MSTFSPPRSVPRTTPDDQNHPRGPPGPGPDTLRKLDVFSEPPGPSPRGPRGLPGTPPGTPRDPPRDAQRPPRALPTTSQGPPREPNRARGPPQRPRGTPLRLFKIYALALRGDRLHVHVTCPPAALAATRQFTKLPYAPAPPRDRPLDSARRNARSD